MKNIEYNLPVKKNKLTVVQKEYLENNLKEAINIGDKLVEIAKKNPYATFNENIAELEKLM